MRPLLVLLVTIFGIITMKAVRHTELYHPDSRSEVAYLVGGNESRPLRDSKMGRMLNWPKKLEGQGYEAPEGISVVALFGENIRFQNKYAGVRVLVTNRTSAAVLFETCDYRLFLVCEAKAPQGEWKAIEAIPRSYCGNSYGNVSLPGGSSWRFAAPRYSGEFKTKLRFRLQSVRAASTPIYSNEFEGSINLKQFNLSPEEELWQEQASFGEEI